MTLKLNRQTVFAVVMGVMMVSWIAGIALSYNINPTQKEVRIESVYYTLLSPQEKIAILQSGRVLIEYLHTGDPDSQMKKAMYESFVSYFQDFVILEVVEIEQGNETMDQMVTPNGDIVPLENVTEAELVDIFCDNTFVQPRECLLRSI